MAIPTGIIALWRGAIVDIPTGWILCTGAGGSPDLRTRFVIGAGALYNPDASGGGFTHQHTLTTDGHFHELQAGAVVAGGALFDKFTDVKTDTATTAAANHTPPYYALAYIYKT